MGVIVTPDWQEVSRLALRHTACLVKPGGVGWTYPGYTNYFTPEAEILVSFALRPDISGYKAVENREKCTECPQNVFEHLRQNYSTYSNYLPQRPQLLLRFALLPAFFS